MDAWRDIDVSWERDARGFVAEDEEMACGCINDAVYFNKLGVSIGVEGQNGMLSDVRGVVDYFWHGGDGVNTWGRIVMGSSMALDDDIAPGAPTDPLLHFEEMADRIYLSAFPYLLQLTDPEFLGTGKWAGGGTMLTWPYAGGTINYSDGLMQFLPAIVVAGEGPNAPTALDPWKVCVSV